MNIDIPSFVSRELGVRSKGLETVVNSGIISAKWKLSTSTLHLMLCSLTFPIAAVQKPGVQSQGSIDELSLVL